MGGLRLAPHKVAADGRGKGLCCRGSFLKILLDECVDRRLAREIEAHEVTTTRYVFGMTEGDPKQLRAAILEAVENQLRDNDPPQAKETFDRLVRSGHSKNEAKRLIAAVLANEISDVANTWSEYDQNRYLSRLKRLPDMPWEYE